MMVMEENGTEIVFDGVSLPIMVRETEWGGQKLAPLGEVPLPKGTIVGGRLISTRGGGADWDCPSYLRYGTGKYNPRFVGILTEEGKLRFRQHGEEYLHNDGAIWQTFAPGYHSAWGGWILLGKVVPYGPSRVAGLARSLLCPTAKAEQQGHLEVVPVAPMEAAEFHRRLNGEAALWGPKILFNHYVVGGHFIAQWLEGEEARGIIVPEREVLFSGGKRTTEVEVLSNEHRPLRLEWLEPGTLLLARHPLPTAEGVD